MVDFFNAENARMLGNTSNSLLLYSAFVKKYPQNATAKYVLSRLQFQNKNAQEAEKLAKSACQLSAQNLYFREFYTQVLVYNNNLKEAEKQYDFLQNQNPKNLDYIFRKAQLYLKEKDYLKAIDELNKYELKAGFNEDIIIQKKNIFLYLKKNESAINEVKKLQKVYPADVDYLLMLADIYEESNNKTEAELIYKNLEYNFNEDPKALVALAQYYTSKKNTFQYNNVLIKIMQNKNITTENKIAFILPIFQKYNADSISKNDEIINLTKSLYENAPENKEALLIYGNTLSLSNHADLATTIYKRYLDIDKTNFEVWTQVFSNYFDEKKYDSSIYYCDQALKYFSDNSIPYYYKGISYLQKHESEKSIIELQNALKIEKINLSLKAQIHSMLGDAYNTQKKYDLSDKEFDEVLKLTPNDATTLNNYAYYLSVRNVRLEDAEKMSKKSLEIQPNSKSFLDTYGWILFQQGKFEDAKIYIEKAIKSNGDDDGTLFEHLGDVYLKLNDSKKAIENWQLAKNKGENNFILLQKLKTGNINE